MVIPFTESVEYLALARYSECLSEAYLSLVIFESPSEARSSFHELD